MKGVLLDLLKQRLAAIEAERPLVVVQHYDVDTSRGPKPLGWKHGLGGSTSPEGRVHRLSLVYEDPHPVHGYYWKGFEMENAM